MRLAPAPAPAPRPALPAARCHAYACGSARPLDSRDRAPLAGATTRFASACAHIFPSAHDPGITGSCLHAFLSARARGFASLLTRSLHPCPARSLCPLSRTRSQDYPACSQRHPGVTPETQGPLATARASLRCCRPVKLFIV
ncbi:hypothetical protein QJS04_geneDACA011406 [Acorus gramineus]|uniref:Uncharacterized protein n=1 Tax=Acorus gramineus TaxID=55184 RepID=A0AAV9AJR1_ACOGR|nr:hypothetical protein QJS04_geneDACA011406 [Acorus gramineus]